MKLSVGTNFDNTLIGLLKDTDASMLYGKISSDLVGGGRPTFALPRIDKQMVESHVKEIHEHGLEFNYLLNAACLDNLETTREFHARLCRFLEWLGRIRVDAVTVTVPFLIDLVKTVLPGIKISLSTFVNVCSVNQALYYEDAGVSEITLPETKNRDFEFLEKLRRRTGISCQLIATNDCLFGCPLRIHHANFQSHASQEQHITKGFALDYCMLRCTRYKIRHPEELLKAGWIRPEDAALYEELGYDKFKLTERMKTTGKIAWTAKVYTARSFDGNLLELLNTRLNESDFAPPDFSLNLNNEFINPAKMLDFFRLIFSLKAEIPNKELDGFLQGLRKVQCSPDNCSRCSYCSGWARRIIKIRDDPELSGKFETFFAEMSSGKIFNMN